MSNVKAIQYTEDNLNKILEIFNISPESVNINYANKSVKLGSAGSKRIQLGEWLVAAASYKADSFVVVSNEIVQNILSAKT